MFKVDLENMIIYLTRGDSVSIVFSAKDLLGEDFHPTKHDRLTFGVAKKYGEMPVIEIVNEMDDDEDAWWTIDILPEHTKTLKFGKYRFDVQVEMRDSVTNKFQCINTIIGETDDYSPTFVLWGEVSQEGDN